MVPTSGPHICTVTCAHKPPPTHRYERTCANCTHEYNGHIGSLKSLLMFTCGLSDDLDVCGGPEPRAQEHVADDLPVEIL